nr:hypothetical protein [Entomoplasma sp. MP1]
MNSTRFLGLKIPYLRVPVMLDVTSSKYYWSSCWQLKVTESSDAQDIIELLVSKKK